VASRGNPLRAVLDEGSGSRRRGLFAFVGDIYIELTRVTWPSRDTAFRLTLLVLAVSIAFSIFLGLWDFGFTTSVDQFLI
jgi:preprotein translocase SecE subunit